MDEISSSINERLERIENRNIRVETDKAWETSKTRIISICVITYIIAIIFMQYMNTKSVYIGALIPVLGFYLSTQSLPIVKNIWVNRYNKNVL